MSPPPPDTGPASPFPFGGFDLSQLLQFLQSEGPLHWDLSRQVGAWVATQGEPEAPVDPATRSELDDLVRAAQVQVARHSGLAETFAPATRAVTRAGFVEAVGPALRPVLEQLATTLRAADADPGAGAGDASGAVGDDAAGNEMFAGMLQALAPMMLGVQAGFLLGHLAQHMLAGHDLPLPAREHRDVIFVMPNIDSFEKEWSLPGDELRFYVALREVVHAAEHAVPWVADRLATLGLEYVSSFRIDSAAFDERFAAVDPTDPSSFEAVLGDPSALLGAMQTTGQRAVLEEFQRFAAVLEGYADALLEHAGQPLIPSFARIGEAMRRHRVERGEAQRFIEQLLGIELGREHYEAGNAFCDGVVERAGLDALNRLWSGEAMIPTRAEFEAPGLWLARLEVM